MKRKLLIVLTAAGLAFSACNSNKSETTYGDTVLNTEDSIVVDTTVRDTSAQDKTERGLDSVRRTY